MTGRTEEQDTEKEADRRERGWRKKEGGEQEMRMRTRKSGSMEN